MTKRAMKKTGRLILWLSALGVGGFVGARLVDANQTGQPIVAASERVAPETTGSIDQRAMRWCGAAPWCH
ncbi:hypothetical protein [Methylobacterium sp. V23]|uniref:hypothetical protein n=1 Tax=Methylobacterium sp. V23 TaxID=2044878 RepID=UPI000CDB8D4A|nr:hypothetical protein [Methylobacterium sp. V23]POR41717.1 hypothetical protein CRT23_17535 [Methylobacterium sp. V23]